MVHSLDLCIQTNHGLRCPNPPNGQKLRTRPTLVPEKTGSGGVAPVLVGCRGRVAAGPILPGTHWQRACICAHQGAVRPSEWPWVCASGAGKEDLAMTVEKLEAIPSAPVEVSDDVRTVCAISVVAGILANVLHEGLG